MRIIGGKYLDSSNYSRIQVSNDKVSISKSNQEALFYNNDFINSLRNKPDNQKVNSIIEHYLNFNRINFVSSDYVSSIDNKKLIINKTYGNDIVRKIISKYKQDRLETLEENERDIYNLHLSKKYSSYDNNGNYYLVHQDYILYDGEVMFLYDLIDIVFGSELAYLIYDNGKMKILSLYGNKIINLSSNIVKHCISDITYAVSNHNQNHYNNMIKNKVIQLKLEVKNGK